MVNILAYLLFTLITLNVISVCKKIPGAISKRYKISEDVCTLYLMSF